MIESLTALGTAIVYLVGCWLLGYRYPFDKYSLYAASGLRHGAAVPFARADGERCRLDDFHRFSGLVAQDLEPNFRHVKQSDLSDEFLGADPDSVDPEKYKCDLRWMIEEAMQWVGEHPAEPGQVSGPVTIEYGYALLRIVRGRVIQSDVIVARGHAWSIKE